MHTNEKLGPNKPMGLYDCVSYKEALIFLVADRKQRKRPITFEAMAEHCRIQKTYLSKVLNKQGNLSQDQLFLACEYLKLTGQELHFLENLHLYDTTLVSARKISAQNSLTKVRKENLKSENSIHVESGLSQNQLIKERYYLDPLYQLIHMFLTIDSFSKDSSAISNKLHISKSKLEKYLADLTDWGLIENRNGRYKVLKNNMHLTEGSYLNSAFRNFSRLTSQSRMNELDNEDFYSFSAIISCDEITKQKIQKRFLDFLKQCQNDVIKADSRDVYQINFDLLKWS